MAQGSGKVHVVRVSKTGYVDKQGRRRDYSSAYLRRTYRDGGKVKNETVANLSALPDRVIDLIDAGLKGHQLVPAGDAVTITRSLPHGHAVRQDAIDDDLGEALGQAYVEKYFSPEAKQQALKIAKKIGYPVMIKAVAGVGWVLVAISGLHIAVRRSIARNAATASKTTAPGPPACPAFRLTDANTTSPTSAQWSWASPSTKISIATAAVCSNTPQANRAADTACS